MKLKILVTGGNGNIAKMIKKNLSTHFEITNLSRNDLNVLNLSEIDKYLSNNNFDILVHTAILGGRRTKEENGDVTHYNLLMLENLLKYADKFKMIINFDSAAIYDRTTDILNRREDDLFTIPTDYYGFSKYVIYQRSLQYNNFYNFRIFNIFHANEEPDRFIKSCFNAKQNNTQVNIFEDKYFDFVYEDDFIKIVKYYFDNIDNPDNLQKTINICYEQKYKLSDIAKLIVNDDNKINILKDSLYNYSGDGSLLKSLNIDLIGLEDSLTKYELLLINHKKMKNLVLITSIVNTPDIPLSYSDVRSVYTHDERFEQTKKTIETIRNKIPQVKIIMVECSDLVKEKEDYFIRNVDYFINLINDKDKLEDIYDKSRSLAEGTMTICALKYIIDNDIEFDNFFKISGRYWLSEKFDYDNFNNDNIVIKYIENNINNVITSLLKLPKEIAINFKTFLENKLDDRKKCVGYECLFAEFIKTYDNKIKSLDPIGVNGNIAVGGYFYSG